jgi:hypothetical protein
LQAGLPDFSQNNVPKGGRNYKNDHKINQTVVKFCKWPQSVPNRHKKYQHFPFQGLPKYTKVGGLV